MKIRNISFWLSVATLAVVPVTSQTPQEGDDLIQPTFVESVNGLLDTTLTIQYATKVTAAVTLTDTRLFNGLLPGPTLKLNAGDKLRIFFQNNLTEQPSQNVVENEFSYPDSSNLHFHGAHVSGELPSDDVTYAVEPGDSYQYETDFPANHMPGTHWLHPHVHGSGALQVGGGAALAIIVQDPDGYLPTDVANAADVLLFVQHMDLTTLQQVATQSGDQMLDISDNIFGNDFRLVNGQYKPKTSMQPGEWQRWRIVYAAWLFDPLDFRFENDSCEMQLLAKDGVYINDYPRTITMAPIPTGGRADIMVRCSNAGEYNVLDYSGDTLMTVTVEGNTVASSDLTAWSPTLPDYLQDLTQTAAGNGCSCDIQFQAGAANCGGHAFCVNGQAFDGHNFIHKVKFGEVVERDLRGINAHPFHQHVYPFQIVQGLDGVINATSDQGIYFKEGDWHDVIMIDDDTSPVNRVTMRYKADVHDGRIMLHCHRLNHEDQGMMAMEDVRDNDECLCDYNDERSSSPTTSHSPTTTLAPSSTPTQSISPSSTPTSSPSLFPSKSLTPTGECEDDSTWRTTAQGIERDCSWATNENRCLRTDDSTGLSGFEACRFTCGTCTRSPSSTPSQSPSETVTTDPPTSTPSLFPSTTPSQSPSGTNLTDPPTSTPSLFPSTSSAPTGGCADDSTWRTTAQGTERDCSWATNNNRCGRTDPNTGLSGFDACRLTCGACTLSPTSSPSQSPTESNPTGPPTSTPPSTSFASAEGCVDDSTWRTTAQGTERDCSWAITNNRCGRTDPSTGLSGFDACRLTCGECTLSPTSSPSQPPTKTSAPTTDTVVNCVDDPNWTVVLNNGSTRDCIWVSGNPANRCSRIGEDGRTGNEACPGSCDDGC